MKKATQFRQGVEKSKNLFQKIREEMFFVLKNELFVSSNFQNVKEEKEIRML